MTIGGVEARVDYEPAESQSGSFGGNSNWRGPVWMPVNYMLVDCVRRYQRYLGDDFTIELPTVRGTTSPSARSPDELTDRLVSLSCSTSAVAVRASRCREDADRRLVARPLALP